MYSHDFEYRRLDRRDARNRLEATGLAWTEHNYPLEYLGTFAIAMLCVAGLLITVLGVIMAASLAGLVKSVSVLAAGVWLMWFAVKVLPRPIKGTPRSVVFHRDGRVEYAHGLPWWPKIKFASAPHTEITSIEARPVSNGLQGHPYDHGVAVFRRNGDIVDVSMSLHRDEAHKVAVQLTQALTVLREDLASLQATRKDYDAQVAGMKAKVGTKKRATVVID